jgi:hypothetical protein
MVYKSGACATTLSQRGEKKGRLEKAVIQQCTGVKKKGMQWKNGTGDQKRASEYGYVPVSA